MRRLLALIGLLVLVSTGARAQFYTNGTDPGHLKWNSIETPHYQVLYPRGTDSLARNYARLLERFRVPSGYSIGLTPGDLQWRKKMPVVLHPFNGYSNGSVGWAPSRMELYTVPEPLGGNPVPWELQLMTHEPRHQAQLQIGFTGWLKYLGYLSGEAASPLGFLFYLDLGLAEGDAVAVETGFGYGTRARTADFLNYYRVALDQGDFRSWDRWRYGSYKHFTPDYYTLGYITIGGIRYFYDYPLFTADFLARSRKKPFSFTQRNMMKTAAERSGKPFKETFTEVLEGMNRQWQDEARAREPFIPQEQLTRARNLPRSYTSTTFLGEALFLLRDDNARGKELVAIRDGKEDIIAPMANNVLALWKDENFLRLYWAETVADIRWELSHRSLIRYYDAARNKIVDLSREGRLYNPRPSADGLRVLTVEYPWDGGSYLTVLSAMDGSVLQRIRVPDGIQATEATWGTEGSFYTFGISEKGYGLYKMADGQWSTVLEPSFQKAVNFSGDETCLEWISDRDGSNELYRYYPEDGRLVQITSARYGLTDAAEDGDYLYYVAQTLEGTMLFRTPLDALQPREVQFADVHTYPMEDALAAQERALGPVPPEDEAVDISAPKPYSKLLHPLRFHTWLPFYVNYDAIESESMDLSYETASLGLTGFFQNSLATVSGYVGYSAHPDVEKGGPWMHSLHGKLSYTGLYPVFEAMFDLGGSYARQYYLNQYDSPSATSLSADSYLRQDPLYSVRLSTYIPLRFNKGGLLAGFVPKLSYTLSNSAYSSRKAIWSIPKQFFSGLPTWYYLSGHEEGVNTPIQRLTASMRGYWMLPVARSAIYPRLGVGLETGFSFRPGLSKMYSPNFYLYGYGYLPGFSLPQGLRLTGIYQQQINRKDSLFGEMYASVLPRGFSGAAAALVAHESATQFRVTADYAIPIYVGDLSLGPVTYIKNFLLTPHFDFSGFQVGNLWSAGADLSARIGHLFFINFDGSVGVSFSYLGGSWYSKVAEGKPFSVSMIFSFDI